MSFKLQRCFALFLIFCAIGATFADTDNLDSAEDDSSPLWSAWERAKSAYKHLSSSNHAEGWEDVKGALGHLGVFFKNKFSDASDFIADNKDDLMPKVRATMQFLNSVRQKIEDIDREYDPQFQAMVKKVKNWMGITQDMEMRIENGEENAEVLRQEWAAEAKRMYDDGLDDVVNFAKGSIHKSRERLITKRFVAV